MTRLMLAGCGAIGFAAHLPALKRLQDEGLVEVVACDADPAKAQRAAAEFGFEAATDWKDAAAGVDAISICTPPGPNAEIAVATTEAGLHVLCEKPPGRDLRQAEAMAEAAHRHPGQVTMVGFNRRFLPLYRKPMARGSALGPPVAFYGRFTRDSLGEAPSNTAVDWVTADSVHALDLAVATIGIPRSVSVNHRVVGTGADNVWTIHLHCDNGSAVLLFDYAAGRRLERYEWAGPGYDASLDPPHAAQLAVAGQGVETWAEEEATTPAERALTGGWVDEYRCFLSAIAGSGPRPASDFAYGADLMRLVQLLLDTPSGTLAAVPPPEPRAVEASAERGAASEPAIAGSSSSSSSNGQRPTVLLQHPPASQPRFFSTERLSAVARHGEVRTWMGDGQTQAGLEATKVIVTGRGAASLPPNVLELAPELELVVVVGASVRHLTSDSLVRHGVRFSNTADAVAQSVAEHCLMASLAGLRRLAQADRHMHAGGWRQGAEPPSGGSAPVQLARRLLPTDLKTNLRPVAERAGLVPKKRGSRQGAQQASGAFDLRGEAVGLIGWGHIARHFARLLAPFGCQILVSTQSADPAELEEAGARTASLGEIMGVSRVISLHKGLTEETRHFLRAEHLAQIRPGSVLVNAARAELIDGEALVARLEKGDIVAALDVFEEEPLPKDHPLRALDNVILTPHQASTTAQEERRMGDQALDIVLGWLEGGDVDTLDSERLARMT